MSKLAEFNLHTVPGATVGVGDVYEFNTFGMLHLAHGGETGQANSYVQLTPEVMRKIAADLTLAAALVEENIERKKNAA